MFAYDPATVESETTQALGMLGGVNDPNEIDVLIAQARGEMDGTVRSARALLASGAAIGRIQRKYIQATFDLMGEVEAQALLAASGDRSARQAMEHSLARLRRLRQEARKELGPYASGAEE